MKRILAVLLALGLMLGGFAAAEEAQGTGLTRDVVILFTSDVHCGVGQNFTYVALKAVKDQMAQSNHVLLVDDGDNIQGEALGTLSTGEAPIELMNAMGYDIAIPGNHEFDYGMDRFLELVGKAKFPYISCNFNREGELVFKPYIIKEFDGVKIGFVGVTTPWSLKTSTPKFFQNENGEYIYGFMADEDGSALYAAVQQAVDDARAEGATYVVLMAHLGNEAIDAPYTYADVVAHTNGIDVVLDGHSHDTDHVEMLNKDGNNVIRQACGTKMNCIGWARIAKDGTVSAGIYTWNNKETVPELLGLANGMTTELAQSQGIVDALMSEVITTTDFDLTITDPVAVDSAGKPVRIVRTTETNLGDLCADAVRVRAGADVGIMNGGGIRVTLKKGDITLGDILKVHPYGNMLTVVEVTGQQLLDILEWSVHSLPSENGGFLQVSGMTFEIHTYLDTPCTWDENGMFTGIEGERRVRNVMVKGEPLDPEATYTLAGMDYTLLNTGDGYMMFQGCKVVLDRVMLDNQVLIDYIREDLGGVIGAEYSEPYGQGRIVAVPEAPAE